MAEIVGSAVIQEAVSQILSDLVKKHEEKEESNADRNLERLEMAHIRLQAALETSEKWQITDESLLRWRRKLKRAAQECDDTLHKCKHRILEEEQIEQEVRNSSFPKRIAHATKSFIFSTFNRNDNELSRSIVQRFEWFADGASEFMRFVEIGGTPRNHITFDYFIRHLFAGKELQYKIDHGNQHPSFLLWLVPFATPEHGIEVCLVFIQKDSNLPGENFFFSVMLQLSESTDIVGIALKCLQLFTHPFKSTVETIRKELTQLPRQDFSWVPYVNLWHRKHWDNLHSFSTQWFRPDPLCCKQHNQHELHRIGNHGMAGLPDVSLESVIEVTLMCQVLPPKYNKQPTPLSECKNSLQESSFLKAGLLFTPHGSSKYMLPANKSCAMATIQGDEPHCVHTDIPLEQLEEMMLPKAIDYFDQSSEAEVYKMLWKSKHGTAYISVAKENIETPGAGRTFRGARRGKLVQQQDRDLGSRAHMVARFLNLWAAHAPVQLQGLIMDWTQKEKESQVAAPHTSRHVF